MQPWPHNTDSATHGTQPRADARMLPAIPCLTWPQSALAMMPHDSSTRLSGKPRASSYHKPAPGQASCLTRWHAIMIRMPRWAAAWAMARNILTYRNWKRRWPGPAPSGASTMSFFITYLCWEQTHALQELSC